MDTVEIDVQGIREEEKDVIELLTGKSVAEMDPDQVRKVISMIRCIPENDSLVSDELKSLISAARGVIYYTEAAYRQAVRDELEVGRMVGVRLHALADLREALLAFEVIEIKNPSISDELVSKKPSESEKDHL